MGCPQAKTLLGSSSIHFPQVSRSLSENGVREQSKLKNWNRDSSLASGLGRSVAQEWIPKTAFAILDIQTEGGAAKAMRGLRGGKALQDGMRDISQSGSKTYQTDLASPPLRLAPFPPSPSTESLVFGGLRPALGFLGPAPPGPVPCSLFPFWPRRCLYALIK